MKCKVLVLTHDNLSEAFVKTAKMIIGDIELLQYMNMPPAFDIEKYKADIEDVLKENQEHGILVLADLMGGSPFISCSQVIRNNWDNMELVTGCNLGMLLAVADEIETKNISELREIALEAGKNGIVDLKKQLKEAERNESKLCQSR